MIRHAAVRLAALLCSILPATAASLMDPFAAMAEGLTLEQAIPIAQRELGRIESMNRYHNHILSPSEGGNVTFMVVTTPMAASPNALLVFCRDRLAAFHAPIAPEAAETLAQTRGVKDALPLFGHQNTIALDLDDDGATRLFFRPVEDHGVLIDVMYPADMFVALNFAGACPEADD